MSTTAIRGALAALVIGAIPVQAQGTFQTLDPSYGGETARRAFFGGFAVSGEAAYRDADLIGFSGTNSLADLSLSARLDYALLPQVDLALVADLSGAAEAQNGRMGLSWVIVKPYWHNQGTDYSVRLAVDPVNDGGLGFRQTEVAFLSTSALSPTVATDLSIGVRRLRTGFSETPGEPDFAEVVPEVAFAAASVVDGEVPVRSRLVGQSLRASWGYNVLFDPAGSRLSFGLMAEAGAYSVLQTREPNGDGGRRGAGRRGAVGPRAERGRVAPRRRRVQPPGLPAGPVRKRARRDVGRRPGRVGPPRAAAGEVQGRPARHAAVASAPA